MEKPPVYEIEDDDNTDYEHLIGETIISVQTEEKYKKILKDILENTLIIYENEIIPQDATPEARERMMRTAKIIITQPGSDFVKNAYTRLKSSPHVSPPILANTLAKILRDRIRNRR